MVSSRKYYRQKYNDLRLERLLNPLDLMWPDSVSQIRNKYSLQKIRMRRLNVDISAGSMPDIHIRLSARTSRLSLQFCLLHFIPSQMFENILEYWSGREYSVKLTLIVSQKKPQSSIIASSSVAGKYTFCIHFPTFAKHTQHYIN